MSLLAQSTVFPAIPYRPFIDPLPAHHLWWIFLPLMALGIAIAYKAVMVKDMRTYWRAVVVMTLQIVVGMLALALASYLLVVIYAKFIAERAIGA